MGAEASEGEAPGARLRVVSANLLRGGVDPGWLRELVSALRADVVALQEATPEHVEALSEQLPHSSLHKGRAGEFHSALALRHPARERGELPFSWRPAPWARLDPASWPGLSRGLDLVAVHVAAPHIYWGAVGYSFWLRAQQLRVLERRLEEWIGPATKTGAPAGGGAASAAAGAVAGGEGAPVSSGSGSGSGRTVVLGDFNATPIWGVYRRVARQMSDAAVVVGQRRGRPVEPTWWLRTTGRRRLRLDHAFTHGVTPHDLQVVDLRDSDHSALVLDLPA